MGAIFICKDKTVHRISPALELFKEMGFAEPTTHHVGDWVLFAYSKMAVPVSNFLKYREGKLITVGTPVYKGLNYTDSLETLLQDFLSDRIDTEQLIGQYTLVFCRGNNIEILSDPLGSKHLFSDRDYSLISSHMLPICECIDTQLHINKKAFYEKLLTGIIMPPNTLFEEVIQIDKNIAEQISHKNGSISFIQTFPIRIPETKSKTVKECLIGQAETLKHYFEQLYKSGKKGIDIGLSGGYDSRLGLACLHKYTKSRIHLHSHSTENDHEKDLQIAKQMAEYVKSPCHTVPTKRLYHIDNADDTIRKSVLYFDGRSSFSIGGCGEVYTAKYRKESTESIPFSLTGVGGELYRNVFDIGLKKIRFDRFMEKKVFSRSFRQAIPEHLYGEIKNEIISKAAGRLEIDQHRKLSKLIAHRYYCEIMMPDGQGVALDAYNQVSCCIAPFLEPRIIMKGYETVAFHRFGGEFEGKLINLIDPGLATISSSYGYPISKRPIKAKIKECLRAYISSSLWEDLSRVLYRRPKEQNNSDIIKKIYANNQMLKEAYLYMTARFPEVNFSSCLHTGEDIRRVQFVAMTLYMLRERIKDK